MATENHRTVFVAGATGAIGQVLCRLLVQDGWQVVGSTRSMENAERLRQMGVQPAIVDVYDRDALIEAVCSAKPDVVVHQLTDLPKEFSAEAMAAARVRNARIREVGTEHLVAAALASGAKRIVAQSIAFAYVQNAQPCTEEAPLDGAAYPSVIRLEQLVLGSGLEAIVLRYGRLYGPNTWTMLPPEQAPVHVDAAADAARFAMTHGETGIYNIVENDDAVLSAKARQCLKWNPDFRCPAA